MIAYIASHSNMYMYLDLFMSIEKYARSYIPSHLSIIVLKIKKKNLTQSFVKSSYTSRKFKNLIDNTQKLYQISD